MLIVLVAGGSSRYHSIVCIGAIADNNLFAAQGETVSRPGSRGFNVGQFKAAADLYRRNNMYDNGENSGSAYLFDTTTGAQIAKLLPSDGEAQDCAPHENTYRFALR